LTPLILSLLLHVDFGGILNQNGVSGGLLLRRDMIAFVDRIATGLQATKKCIDQELTPYLDLYSLVI